MKNKKTDFKIVPVFKQAKPIWVDFVHIETKVLNYDVDIAGQKHVLSGYAQNWRQDKYSFAFAAYYKNQMIGFAKGCLGEQDETFLDHLYVLPEYRKWGVGSQLLNAMEQASCLVAYKMSLYPLSGSMKFYDKHKYTSWHHYMIKDVPNFTNCVIPVFQWIVRSFHSKFNVDVDNSLIRQNKHQPIFVHLNKYGEVDGVAVRTKGGENKIWTDVYQNKCRYKLLNALNKVK